MNDKGTVHLVVTLMMVIITLYVLAQIHPAKQPPLDKSISKQVEQSTKR